MTQFQTLALHELTPLALDRHARYRLFWFTLQVHRQCLERYKESSLIDILLILGSFGLLALAAKEIGKYVRWVGLPLISGFLLTGVVAGPYGLGIVDAAAVQPLRFIDAFALAFIAFAAGAELELTLLRNYLRNIIATVLGQAGVVMVLGTIAFILLADSTPFMQNLPTRAILAIALIGATIMAARSPSSAYAIIKELRARGAFTQTVLGVTVLMDAVVIVLYAMATSFAAVLVNGGGLNATLFLFLIFEIALDVAIGILIGQFLRLILAIPCRERYKMALILLTGYTIFYLSSVLHKVHLWSLPVGVFSEPLLIGMVAGFVVANYTRYRVEFQKIVEDAAPVVFLLFFTLVGLSLELNVLAQTWVVALLLLLVRVMSIYLGSLLASAFLGRLGGQPAIFSMSFITQAGVSIGLAKEVGVEFPAWGNEFASLIIGVIVINQVIGPPFLKWALHLAGEVHPRAEQQEFDGIHDVIIFGIDEQSLALARQLKAHQWQVKLADIEASRVERLVWPEVEAHTLSQLTPDVLRTLEIEKADAIVAMLDDDSNYTLCELAYEHFGTAHLVARLYERDNLERFRALGVLIVDPSTAIINLLDHCVRSPSATTLLLGQEIDQDVIEVTVGNRALHGIALRDLHLPVDTLILSIRRNGQLLLSHGYSRLELGDEVTVVGHPKSLQEVQWYLEAYPYV